MKNTTDTSMKLRNLAFWIIAAVTYPVAHWIPTSSGHPPRIFDVLIPIFIMALGLASTATLRPHLPPRGKRIRTNSCSRLCAAGKRCRDCLVRRGFLPGPS